MAMLTGAYVSLDDLSTVSDRSPRSRIKRTGLATPGGQRIARPKGRGVDFDEVRLYQPGDDVRNIDWKVTARKQRPHTKIFREERERPTLVVVDQSHSMFFGSRIRLKSVAAAEVAARLAFQTLHAGDRIGGIVIGINGVVVIEPRRTGRNIARILGAIVSANQSLEPSQSDGHGSQLVARAVTQIRRVVRFNFRVLVVSDFVSFDDEAISDVLSLSRHNQLQLLFVYDELERELPPASLYWVTDGSGRVRFDSSNQTSRELYANRFSQRRELLFESCLANRVEFREIATTLDLDRQFLDE